MYQIRTENLHKEFNKGEVVAVDDLTITFPEGTTTCLLGPSGCGKTTLMRMIAGLETPTRGRIFFGDQEVTRLSTRNRKIGMVFQYPVVYRGSDVRSNIELPLRAEGLSASERTKRVDEVVELLEMKDAVDRPVDSLDNGTRQKVAVARAVARHPRIILFDEPITNVDISSKLQLKRALKELITRLRQTIVYVTHDQTEAMTLADQIALMKDGKIIQYAPPRELYNRPNDVFGGWFLGNPGMNFFDDILHPANGALSSPLLAGHLFLSGDVQPETVTLGIRPEDVQVSNEPLAVGVQGSILRRSIVIGGQFLLVLQVGEHKFKAKVPGRIGRELNDDVWIALPPEKLSLFGKDGHKPNATLAVEKELID